MPAFDAIKDVVLFLLALYGAALSTFNWRQAANRDKRLVRVTLSTTMLAYGDGSLGTPFAQISAINVGHRAVTIETIAIELPGGRRLVPSSWNVFPGKPDTPLPATLNDGESAVLLMPYSDLGHAIGGKFGQGKIEMVPIAVDSAGGTHKGKPWHSSSDELMSVGRG